MPLNIQTAVYGAPVAGKATKVSYDNTDKTITVDNASIYILYATTDVFLGSADTSAAANQSIYLPANTLYAMHTGALTTIHATQVSAAGTLYAGKVQE